MHWKMLRLLYSHDCRSPERMRLAIVLLYCFPTSGCNTLYFFSLIVVEVRFSVKAPLTGPFWPAYLLLKGSYVWYNG